MIQLDQQDLAQLDGSQFRNVNLTFNGNPSCLTRGNGLIDCVARGQNNHVYYNHYNGSRWSTWADFGGSAKSDPMCSSSRSNRIDCFYFSFANKVYYKTKQGSARWTNWREVPQAGGSVNAFLGCTTWRWQIHSTTSSTDRFDCFAKGSHNYNVMLEQGIVVYKGGEDGNKGHGNDFDGCDGDNPALKCLDKPGFFMLRFNDRSCAVPDHIFYADATPNKARLRHESDVPAFY